MLPPALRRHGLRTSVAVALLVLAPLAAACSSDDATPPASSTTSGTAGTTPGTTAELNAEELLAEAKTVAVGFFQAQAINDYDRALERSEGGAALTIEWARAVNGIAAAEDSGYQVPTVDSPNVRVQIDELTPGGAGVWNATGFIELSFRPGPVASTTTTAAPSSSTTAAASPSTYIVDLSFVEDGDALKVLDYRLDDLPYPVSQLFMAIDTPDQEAAGVTGQTVLGHRDLDGSVQYVVALEAGDDPASDEWRAAFTPAPAGSPPGTAVLPVGPDTVEGTLFVDPITAGAKASALIVFPGAFPGSAGTLTLASGPAASTTTTSATPGGTAPATAMNWALPDFPELTPRPTNTVDVTTTSTSTTSSTTSSTTTSTTTPSSTVAPASTSTTGVTTTTRPSTTSTTVATTTTSTTAG